MVKQIPKQVLQGLGSIAEETLKQTGEAVGLVSAKTGGGEKMDLTPDIAEMTPEDRKIFEEQEKAKKEAEMNQIRAGMGRNVEGEMEQVRQEKEKEKQEEEQEFLENLKRQREAEAAERTQIVEPQGKTARGSAFARGKGKPRADQMSQTSEFSKKPD